MGGDSSKSEKLYPKHYNSEEHLDIKDNKNKPLKIAF